MKKLYYFARKLFNLYIEKGLSGMSAQLSYYMLFTFFPVLLFGSAVLARIVPSDFELDVENIIPLPVSQFAGNFIGEVEDVQNKRLLFTAALLTFYSLTKYIRSYRASIRKIYGISPRFNFFTEWIYSFLFSAAMFILFCLSVVAVFFTDNILDILGLDFFTENIWFALRFFAVAIYAFFVLSIIHRAEFGKSSRLKDFFKGSFASVLIWIVISALFSYYVGEIADYSVLYGSIGNVIMLLVWLNLTNTSLLLCAGINIILKEKC